MQVIAVITPTGTNYSVSSSAQTLTVPITLTGAAVNVSFSPLVSSTFLTSVTKETGPLRYEIVFEREYGFAASGHADL